MKLFYTTDGILEDECKQVCPNKMSFSEYDVITRVGSWHCTHKCPHCYGRSREFAAPALFANPDGSDKPFTFRTEHYVKCAGVYNKPTWYTKVYVFLYKYVGKYIVDLIDKIDRNA